MRLEAASAPTPPQLPPAQPTQAVKQPGRKAAVPPGATPPSQDLLRCLAAAVAESGWGSNEAAPGGMEPSAAAGAAQASGGSSTDPAQLQRMLEELTAALQVVPAPAAPPADAAQQPEEGASCLGAALQQHGLDPALVRDASSLLQVGGPGCQHRRRCMSGPSGSTCTLKHTAALIRMAAAGCA